MLLSGMFAIIPSKKILHRYSKPTDTLSGDGALNSLAKILKRLTEKRFLLNSQIFFWCFNDPTLILNATFLILKLELFVFEGQFLEAGAFQKNILKLKALVIRVKKRMYQLSRQLGNTYSTEKIFSDWKKILKITQKDF